MRHLYLLQIFDFEFSVEYLLEGLCQWDTVVEPVRDGLTGQMYRSRVKRADHLMVCRFHGLIQLLYMAAEKKEVFWLEFCRGGGEEGGGRRKMGRRRSRRARREKKKK